LNVKLQKELWLVVQNAAAAQPTPVFALALSGMNDVFNSQGFAQAAWGNRIPLAAWALMGAIAIGSNLLFGYTARRLDITSKSYLILPLFVAVAFCFIADLDSPRGGVIHIEPRNLISVEQSIEAQSQVEGSKNVTNP
jgi:hypothetical protein